MREKLCRKCGETKPVSEFPKDRNRSDGLHSNCKACRVAQSVDWERRNAERRAAYKRKLRAESPSYAETGRAYSQSYRATYPERARASVKAYALRNPHSVVQSSANRRARAKVATPKWGLDEFDRFVKEEAARLAKRRNQATGIDWHVDHIEPLQGKLVSGLHIWNNLQVIPASINFSKGNRRTEGNVWL